MAMRRGIAFEFGGMVGDPARGEHAVVQAGGEFVLGRQAIIHRDHDALRAGAQVAAHAVMRVQAAQHEAAAVEECQQRERPLPDRPIDAQLQVAARALDGAFGYRADRRGWRHQADARFVLRARSATDSVLVAGTPVPMSSNAWICGSTGMRATPRSSSPWGNA